jgi:maleylpyruvate isomerase
MIPSVHDIRLLSDSAGRVEATVRHLAVGRFAEPSRLQGWTRAHVLAHIAGSASSRTGLLIAASQGRVERQYASEQRRADEIDENAALSPDNLRLLVATSLADLLAAITIHPAAAWAGTGDWLGVGPRPVARVVPSMRRELEYHHVDLDAGYGIEDWPDDFVDFEVRRVTTAMSRRPEAPPVTVVLPDQTLQIGAHAGPTVDGEPAALLAWLTGRERAPAGLRVRPAGALPMMPPLA